MQKKAENMTQTKNIIRSEDGLSPMSDGNLQVKVSSDENETI